MCVCVSIYIYNLISPEERAIPGSVVEGSQGLLPEPALPPALHQAQEGVDFFRPWPGKELEKTMEKPGLFAGK